MEFVEGGDLYHNFHHNDKVYQEIVREISAERKKWQEKNLIAMENFSEISQEEFDSLNQKKLQIDQMFLEAHLKQLETDRMHLSWKLRYKIALDIANAM